MAASDWMSLFKGVACVVAAFAVIANVPTRYWMPAEKVTLNHLKEAPVINLDNEEHLKAGKLWQKQGAVIMVVRRPGCWLCREEAHELSTLKSRLDGLGVNLIAIVHERLGTEDFQPYFKGPIYLDMERRFYGPRERWMLFSALFRPSVYLAGLRANYKGFSGNLQGEGRLLGGVFVIGSGDQGVLLEHRESEFGDHASLTEVFEAAQRIVK